MELGEINNYILDRNCPNCDNHLRILLNDIILEKIVVCPTCHSEVKPIDPDGIAKKAKEKLIVATREVHEMLKNIAFNATDPPENNGA